MAALAQTFFYDSFEVNIEGGCILFKYSTDAGHVFIHTLTHEFPPETDVSLLAPAAFALGLAELPGYWKAILAPKIVIKAGALSEEQLAFWEKLYTKGLGEFFFVNKIDFHNLINVSSSPDAPTHPRSTEVLSGALVPLGGGKDSLVTGELLKQHGTPFEWFELEPLPGNAHLRELSDVTDSVSIGRDVQKNFAPIVELVQAGAPNGHVPITATYIFSAVFAALVHGFRDIIPSLERSAEIGNVEYLGETINHQYSKTLEFEKQVHMYVQDFIHKDLRVFSLLRPYYEIQIVEKFTHYPQYFDSFISCNRGLKTNVWCGECAKCAFMFAALSAFLEPQRVVSIFKKNLFEDVTLVSLYTDMIGMGSMKPFDCIGTFEENLLALYLSGEQYAKASMTLPIVLASLPIADGAAHQGLLIEHGQSIIPSDYA